MSDRTDVLVYGATPAGIVAAVAAARLGASVRLVGPGSHVGGMLASGLNTAEAAHMLPESLSGMPLEFFRRSGAAYGSYGPLFHWESHVAEAVILDMLREAGVDVRSGGRVLRVVTGGGRVVGVDLASGEQVQASN